VPWGPALTFVPIVLLWPVILLRNLSESSRSTISAVCW
jgi:hypothetical protein